MLEKQKLELEFELDRVTGERNELHSTLEKRTNSNEHQELEIRQLKTTVAQLDEERGKLRAQSSDQSADLASLKKELISAEQARLDLDSEKLAISERLKCLEMEKDKIEAELSCVARERNDLSNQLATISRDSAKLPRFLFIEHILYHAFMSNEKHALGLCIASTACGR